MRKILSTFVVFLLAILSINTSYASSATEQYIDIKLSKPLNRKDFINFSSNTGFSLVDSVNKDYIMDIQETNIIATLNNDSIYLMDSRDNIIIDLPKDGSILIKSNTFNDSIITVEKDRYRDYIKLISRNNEILVINHVQLENYLYGVVPAEMPASFHIEALKAQAVAARSFTLSNLNKHIGEGFNLCDTTHCQVYSGVEYERPVTNSAVDVTKGILAYYKGKVIEAIYHSTSSGFTEDSVNVWGGDVPYLKPVEDSFSSESPYSNWKFSIGLNELNNNLKSSGVNIGDFQGVEVIDATSTGKVDKVKITGTIGEKIISGTEFRNIIGAGNFKSAWFTINGGNNVGNKKVYVIDGSMNGVKNVDINNVYTLDDKNQKTVTRGRVNRAISKDRIEDMGRGQTTSTTELIIEGKGFGHGVGMSQFGAKKMAELGYTFEEILKYYYTGIDIM
jgi:stage II sporulation protein D